jgi:hypothetical protein
MKWFSEVKPLGDIRLPAFMGIRIQMMPVILGYMDSIPYELRHFRETILRIFCLMDQKHIGQTGYLTIDEKFVRFGQFHRRPGLHVDAGGWGGSGPRHPAASADNGMIVTQSHEHTVAYHQAFEGEIGEEGDCKCLRRQAIAPNPLKAFKAYWLSGLTVHGHISPMLQDTARQFVRLSLPSDAPWFDGYTENPLGVKPTGPVLPRRKFMDL